MNIGYHSDFMDRIIERADKRQERTEKMINKMLDKSEVILQAGKPQPMTNEEYLKSLDTKQLAKFLADKFNEVVIAEWLKQPHSPKE